MSDLHGDRLRCRLFEVTAKCNAPTSWTDSTLPVAGDDVVIASGNVTLTNATPHLASAAVGTILANIDRAVRRFSRCGCKRPEATLGQSSLGPRASLGPEFFSSVHLPIDMGLPAGIYWLVGKVILLGGAGAGRRGAHHRDEIGMDGNGNIIGGVGVAWGKCDASELLVVEFEGVSSLLDLPIADPRMRGDFREEPLDFGATQIMFGPARVFREEPLDPADAEGDVFFLSPGRSENGQISFRPLGCRVFRSGHARGVLTHSKTPLIPCYASRYTHKPLQSKKNLTDSKFHHGMGLCYF